MIFFLLNTEAQRHGANTASLSRPLLSQKNKLCASASLRSIKIKTLCLRVSVFNKKTINYSFLTINYMKKKNIWGIIIQTLITVLTAIGTSLGVTSCM